MIRFRHSGNFNNTEKLLTFKKSARYQSILESYGKQGVSALASATPKDTGITSNSWDYEVKVTKTGYSLMWTNSNVSEGIPIVILLQYGHGTRSGTFVEGRDFINPAIKPIIDKIADDLWKEVSNL